MTDGYKAYELSVKDITEKMKNYQPNQFKGLSVSEKFHEFYRVLEATIPLKETEEIEEIRDVFMSDSDFLEDREYIDSYEVISRTKKGLKLYVCTKQESKTVNILRGILKG